MTKFDSRFNGFLMAESADQGAVRIRRLNADEKSESQSRLETLKNELESLIGFRHIIDALICSKKPIIGHNMLLDMCHTYQAFCDALPNEVEDFKDAIQTHFPVVFDTKHMANIFPQIQDKMDNTVLGNIMNIVESEPFHHPQIRTSQNCGQFIQSLNLKQDCMTNAQTLVTRTNFYIALAMMRMPLVSFS